MRVGFSDYKTTILKYYNETGGNVDQWYEGKRYGDVWGLTTDRIMQSATESMPDQSYYYATWGPEILYIKTLTGREDHPGCARTLDNHGDLSVIANTTPRFAYNFSIGVNWKDFDLNMFWQGIGETRPGTQ